MGAGRPPQRTRFPQVRQSRSVQWAIPAAVLAVVVLAAGCSGGAVASDEVQARALWFGKTADGEITAGVTPVNITAATKSAPSPFSVDLQGITQAGAGSQWTAATASAAVLALLSTAKDPRTVDLKYALNEAIDGPSAGGLLAVASKAALEGGKMSTTISMTGTILPDGSLGRVGGIPEKIRGVKAQGITQVFIPASQAMAVDPRTGNNVDVVELGKSIGVEVSPVATIWQAAPTLTGVDFSIPNTEPPPLDQGLVALLRRQAEELIATTRVRMRQQVDKGAIAADSVTAKQESAIVGRELAAATAKLTTDPVAGFGMAGEAAQSVQMWIASADLTKSSSAGRNVGQLIAALKLKGAALSASIKRAVGRAAQTPVVSDEQLVSLCDALTWGIDAYTAVGIVTEKLGQYPQLDELDRLTRELARARFDADSYMPTATAAVSLTGLNGPAPSAGDVALLDAYADLLAYAGAANATYTKDVNQRLTSGSATVDDSAAHAKELWEQLPQLLTPVTDPTAKAAIRAAAAISYFMVTTVQVSSLSEAASGVDVSVISDQDSFKNHVAVASELTDAQARRLTEAGLDSSYLRWNEQWGRQSALAAVERGDNTAALAGLSYQWFANVEGQLLLSLADADS